MKIMCIVDNLKGLTKFKIYDIDCVVTFDKGCAYKIKDDTGNGICIDTTAITGSSVCVKGISAQALDYISHTISKTGKKFIRLNDQTPEKESQLIIESLEDMNIKPYNPIMRKFKIHFKDKSPMNIECDLPLCEIMMLLNRRYCDYIKLGKYVIKREIIDYINEM